MTASPRRQQRNHQQPQPEREELPQHQNAAPPQMRHRAALHLTTTLSALLSLPSVWPNLKNASPDSRPSSLSRLSELSAQHPDLAPYLTREMAVRARQFMNGVALYRQHPAQRALEQTNVIWQSGTTLLRDYAPKSLHAPIILVVPSLINRFSILDLQPRHSLLRELAMHGFRPLVVDWDMPGEDEKNFSLNDYITRRLLPALHFATREGAVHVMGYCMGGNLALALACLMPEKIRSLSLLATPWDFHAGYRAAGQDGQSLEEKLAPWLSKDAPMPVEVVQSVFTGFQPLHAFRKFSSFAAMEASSNDAARFVLTEDWLNDGVPLTARAARDCFGDWCARNILAKNQWRVAGHSIDPSQVILPSYVVVPGKDRIVPPESAMPLAHALPHAVRHEPMMGHIGIMASKDAPERVWKPLINWLGTH
jgi:polyhydroxyalkanoate synthase